ncbi:hypothetical protein CWI37_2832p0010 [Hamiltosporidium tvaerminnensis]|uniref:Uncharacterized protein n=1 Tax=Hamiltosporidium tvaerminnensis TaxID=1176355 RepID=A0A4Q9KPX2_9MICR|nr:hypothetical protein CWI37_2832p0010 [Hamiltosporidium tvaerminnensis]
MVGGVVDISFVWDDGPREVDRYDESDDAACMFDVSIFDVLDDCFVCIFFLFLRGVVIFLECKGIIVVRNYSSKEYKGIIVVRNIVVRNIKEYSSKEYKGIIEYSSKEYKGIKTKLLIFLFVTNVVFVIKVPVIKSICYKSICYNSTYYKNTYYNSTC